MGNYATASAAYWGFFETFNARSAAGRAGVMSYPHLRMAAGRSAPTIAQTAAEFEANASASWDAVDVTGWAWTQPITPRVVHRSSDKVHFAGGWTRFRADGSVIRRNRLLYVATETDEGWGIQAGLGVEGDLTGEAAEPTRAAALDALARTMRALESGDVDSWLDCFHYPLAIVLAPGQIELFQTRAEMDAAYRDWAGAALPVSYEAHVLAAGESAALVEQSIQHGDDAFQQCFLIVERDGVWATPVVSAVRPDA